MASTSAETLESPPSFSEPSVEEKSSLSNSTDDQHRKLFIGGLSYTTTDEKLKEYCSNYGEVTECVVMRDREGRSRGFAFVSFQDRNMLDKFMFNRPHIIDGRQTEPKRAMSRDETSRNKGPTTVTKIFIGGIKEEFTEDDLKSYFQKYGNIIQCNIMKDKEDKLRGFAFITFDDYDAVDQCILGKPHRLHEKELDVRKAIPREQTQRSVNHSMNSKVATPLNTDFYQFPTRYPTSLINHPPTIFAPYSYLPAANFVSKPMPLMATPSPASTSTTSTSPNGTILSAQPIIYPSEMITNPLFRTPPTYPSPPTSTSPLGRTNSSANQNGTKKKSSHDQTTIGHEISKLSLAQFIPPSIGDYSTPIRTKTRSMSNGANSEQHRKLFIGGLSFKTTDETLKEYVTKFGEVSDSLVMKDPNGQSRCFGFVTFVDPKTIDEFMKQRPHIIDGREIDPKRAMPREEANNDDVHLTVKKIFIGGIRDGLDEEKLRNYFGKFGQVNDCFLMYDKEGKIRGFAFLEFDDFDSVDKVILARPHIIDEHRVDVKKAVPRDQRLMQAQHQHQQQQQQHFHQQQQQYALQMQAMAAYHHYYFNQPPFGLLTPNGNYPIALSTPPTAAAAPPSLLTPSGTPHGALIDEMTITQTRPSTNSNHHSQTSSNSPRYTSSSNNRRQSSRGSQ